MSIEEKPIQDNVINGPWKKKPKREVILQNEQIVEDQENMMFCDSLAEGLIVQIIHAMDVNGF